MLALMPTQKTSLGTPTASITQIRMLWRTAIDRIRLSILRRRRLQVKALQLLAGTIVSLLPAPLKASGGPQAPHLTVSLTTRIRLSCRINQSTQTHGAINLVITMENLSTLLINMALISMSVARLTGAMRISTATCSRIILTWSRIVTLTARRAALSLLSLVR